MTDNPDNTRFALLREEEEQRQRDRELAGDPVPEEHTYEPGKEPGHLGNDLSTMKLLETDLERLAKSDDDREPNPDVQQALRDLEQIDTGPFPDEE